MGKKKTVMNVRMRMTLTRGKLMGETVIKTLMKVKVKMRSILTRQK